MTHSFRQCPKNKLIIEWRLEQDGARWGFYRVCDSPADAKRSLAVINGGSAQEAGQLELLEIAF